jgi:N-acyl-D-amino-acid deacylase
LLDTIFRGARIYDGTGTSPYTTDLAVAEGRVVVIGDCSERDAHATLDCSGLGLAPGFIDVHSHSDELWLVDGRALGKVMQGVTTEIGGNCGSSPAPLAGYAYERKVLDAKTYRLDVDWSTFDGFFAAVEHSGVACNVASLVGLGTTRRCIAGPAARRLERDELERETRLVREAVEQGALGVSSGWIYEPSRYADRTELVACAAAARAAGGALYVSHIRDEGDALVEAIDEALDIGRGADVAVRCSHHKAAGRRNWGKIHRTLETIDRARSHGEDVAIDAYPYVAMWTDLATILPDAIRRGGEAATLERLRDPAHIAATALQLAIARDPTLGGDSWHDILITDVGSERNADLVGLRIDELAARWRLSPARTAIQLLDEEDLRVECAFFAMSEDDVATVLSAEFCCIGSDASARAFDGPTARGAPHPRTYGCFPRVFGRFVRSRRIYSVEEAIRRMTSLPADLFGLAGRGRIAPGAWADLVVFDPERIADRATYERPFVAPEGIRDCFVNGTPVIRDGSYTGARPGRVLRGGR